MRSCSAATSTTRAQLPRQPSKSFVGRALQITIAMPGLRSYSPAGSRGGNAPREIARERPEFKLSENGTALKIPDFKSGAACKDHSSNGRHVGKCGKDTKRAWILQVKLFHSINS